ncbi:Serine/arginine-rich splicing factor 1 [Branchiostoma belcheri]|nr:Serine/arginine-rich splicing factor 1 [Branchiostoma belcheri]
MSFANNDCRIYVGNLPPDIRVKDIEDIFYKYGNIRHIDLKNKRGPPFAFVEFDDKSRWRQIVGELPAYKWGIDAIAGDPAGSGAPHVPAGPPQTDEPFPIVSTQDSKRWIHLCAVPIGQGMDRCFISITMAARTSRCNRYLRDAEDAVRGRDGYNYDGYRLRVEFPRGTSRGGYRGGRRVGQPSRRSEYRVLVSGLPPTGSWQDLKDHMREAGDVCYADVFRDGTGVVEFLNYEDMKYAVKQLDDSKFRSHEGETSYIRVKEDYHPLTETSFIFGRLAWEDKPGTDPLARRLLDAALSIKREGVVSME